MSDNQQLAFHAWLSRRGIASNYAGDGQYEEPRVQLAWESWTTAVDEMRPRAAVEADRQSRMPSDDLHTFQELLSWAEAQICMHEETHRGGSIWEICDQCGAKWADDEGGKPEFQWPKQIVEARALLSRYSSGQPKPSNSGELEQPAASAGPEFNGWYCAHCQRGVDSSEVTCHEQHQECGRVITDDRPPAPVAAQATRTVAGDLPHMSADVRAALLYALWRHQGGSSTVGQQIRALLGMRQYECMTPEQCDIARSVQSALSGQPTAQDREDAIPDSDAVDLAREGMELHKPGQPEYIVCAELVRVAARATKGAGHG